MGIMLGFQDKVHAYISVPSTSYSLEVGVDKYLSVPNGYDGYIDHAVWACSNSAISFKQKDAAGAIIQITRAFSGTAIIELLATEKYLDTFGRTRARTYYKQYLINCKGGGGSSTEESEIIFPESISLNVGESKRYKIYKNSTSPFSINWKKYTNSSFIYMTIDRNNGYIDVVGVMPGEGILTITSSSGSEKDCKITVTATDVTTNRRTEKDAVSDIKTLIANIVPIVKTAGIEDVLVDFDYRSIQKPNHIYSIQGILLKENATQEDIQSLVPGFYIIGGKKIIVR